jgi:hypothetical protein
MLGVVQILLRCGCSVFLFAGIGVEHWGGEEKLYGDTTDIAYHD